MRAPALAIVLVLGSLLAPLASSTSTFQEDWETGMDGWVVEGSGADVLCPASGCALHVSPPSDTWVHVTHPLDVPLDGRVAATFRFRPNHTWGDTDSHLALVFDQGKALFETTNGRNNGLGLVAERTHQDFASYPRAEWLDLRLVVDGPVRVAQAQWLVDGVIVGASRILPIHENATRITGVGVSAVAWAMPTGFWYDDIAVGPSDACFAPQPRIVGDAGGPAPFEATIQLEVATEGACPIEAWHVTFGDEHEMVGAGVPPAEVRHTYAADGYYQVSLRIGGPGFSVVDLDHVWVDSTREQVVHGTAGPQADVLGVGEAAVFDLDVPANGTERAWLYADIGSDLDAVFLDASGEPLADQPCATLSLSLSSYEPSESCVVPAGAASVRIEGIAADAFWWFVYEYPVT